MPVPDLLPAAWRPLPAEGPPPIALHAQLQAIGWDYGDRLAELEEETMGGRTASPVFGQTVAQADIYWRLRDATGRGSWLPDDAATTWRDTALAGSLLAVNKLVDETVARAPQIETIRTALDLVANPNLSLALPKGRNATFGHETGGENARKVAAQELQQAPDPNGRGRPMVPKVNFGLNWSTRASDAPPGTPFLEYGAWISTTSIGISNFRADYDLLHSAWSLTGREKLARGIFLVATARSDTKAPTASAWTAGLMWTPPWTLGWTLRADRKQTFDLNPDVTWTVSLVGEEHTATPRGVLY